jgi:serine/threonine-protein kinase
MQRSAGPVCERDALARETVLVARSAARFVIERAIAEGGMAIVHEARAEDGTRVALKVLKARHLSDAGLVARFRQEIAQLRRVSHPNLVRFIDRGALDDGRPFYAMELCDGPTLGEWVCSNGPLPLGVALEVADQILAALAAMHAAGIVHRDLQPDNVVLVRANAPDAELVVKLIDLGFSQAPGVDHGDGVTADSPGALVGTLRFMAPEQALRARAITEQSDLFVVGLLIHYALTATLPFRATATADPLIALVRRAPTPLRRVRRDVPRSVDAAVRRALAKHPTARFADAAEMREALAAAA